MLNRTKTKTQNRNEKGGSDNELFELFLDELADVYNAEKQLTKALPKMAKAAENEALQDAFTAHLKETETQIKRLEEVAELLDESIKRKTCAAMKGLVEEAEELMEEQEGTAVLDAALIAAAQKVEHYEIATYGTLYSWAEQLGRGDAAKLLKETLAEEKAADDKLTEVAESQANLKG